MLPSEVALVLAKAASFDNRKIGETNVLAWHEVIGDLEFGDALAAVARHYGRTTDWMMPVHLRQLVQEIERDRRRVEREQREAIEASRALPAVPTQDRSEEVLQLLHALAEKLGPSDPTVLRRREWVEADRQRERLDHAEPNPEYVGPPPPGGHPVPGEGQEINEEEVRGADA